MLHLAFNPHDPPCSGGLTGWFSRYVVRICLYSTHDLHVHALEGTQRRVFGARRRLIPFFRWLWVFGGYIRYGGVPQHALEGSKFTAFYPQHEFSSPCH
jgi:hypothetical protein